MSNWEANIRRVVPYVPGEQPKDKNVIKLNTNENPYGPSPNVISQKLDLERLRLYPDPEVKELVCALASYHGIDSSQVFVGVGSDDVIAMSFMTFFNSGRKILFPDITYSFYDVWADMLKIPYEQLPVDDGFKLVKEDYYRENGGIIFANPNAPTGIAEPVSFVRDILEHNQDVVVIVDEAYVDFGGETALSLISEFDNLLVVRTFSKSRSMAGIRIGYAMGNARLIKYLNDVKYSYNSYTMNMPSILYGTASIADDEYFKATVLKIIETREWFVSELYKLGFSCPKSSANFVFATHNKVYAEGIFEGLKQRGIYVRYFKKPRIDNYLRITIGTKEEMQTLLENLRTLI